MGRFVPAASQNDGNRARNPRFSKNHEFPTSTSMILEDVARPECFTREEYEIELRGRRTSGITILYLFPEWAVRRYTPPEFLAECQSRWWGCRVLARPRKECLDFSAPRRKIYRANLPCSPAAPFSDLINFSDNESSLAEQLVPSYVHGRTTGNASLTHSAGKFTHESYETFDPVSRLSFPGRWTNASLGRTRLKPYGFRRCGKVGTTARFSSSSPSRCRENRESVPRCSRKLPSLFFGNGASLLSM